MYQSFIIVSIVLNIVIIFGGAVGFIKVIGNDLKHVAIDLNEIKTRLDRIAEKAETVGNRLTSIETKCQERHSRRRKTK